jgi:hypothetical protein
VLEMARRYDGHRCSETILTWTPAAMVAVSTVAVVAVARHPAGCWPRRHPPVRRAQWRRVALPGAVPDVERVVSFCVAVVAF